MHILQILALVVMSLALAKANTSSEEDMKEDGSFLENFVGGASPEGLKKMQMIAEEGKTCIDLNIPPVAKGYTGMCFMEAVDKSAILKKLIEGTFPGKDEFSDFLDAFTMCKLKKIPVKHTSTSVDLNDWAKNTKFTDWGEDQKDKEILKTITDKCISENTGDTATKIMKNFYKCQLFSMMDYCEKIGESDDVGMLVVMMAKLLIMDEPSKCDTVVIPEKYDKLMTECLNEAKESFTPLEETMQDFANKDIKTQMMHLKERYMKDIFMKMGQCYIKKIDLGDSIENINFEKFIEDFKNFQGWDGLQKEKDEVINAIRMCASLFSFNSSDASGEEDPDSVEDTNNMMEILEAKMEYDKCLISKYIRICGINNDMGRLFSPLMNKDFLAQLMEAFMEVGGDTSKKFADMIKEKLNMFMKMTKQH